MWFHLRFGALVSLAWLVLILVRPGAGSAELIALMPSSFWALLATVHAVLAVLFTWGSFDPPARLGAVFTGLAVFAARSVLGIYLVLYILNGAPAMIVLVEMVLSLGLCSAFVNGLPAVMRPQAPTAD